MARLRARNKAAQAALHESHDRYERMATHLPGMLFEFESWGRGAGQARLSYASPYSLPLFGVAPDVLVRQGMLPMVHPEDKERFCAVHLESMAAHRGYDMTVRVLTVQGQERWVQMVGEPASSEPGNGLTHWSGFVFDVTERKRLEQDLHALAYHDPLTNAHNRRSFMEALQQELQRVQRTGAPAGLLMLDIDHFKQVNDQWGHEVGDRVLQHLVALLQSHLRRIDVLGRLGGEEFAILLPATDLQGARELAERLRGVVEQSPVVMGVTDGPVLPYTISVGVACMVPGRSSFQQWLRLADQAMYRAKTSGRNRVCVADGVV